MKNREFNGLNYRRFGNGPTVVFIHGFLESIAMWEYLSLEKLPIDCILVDLPGFGLSILEKDDAKIPSMEIYADKLQELMDHLAVSTFKVVGHSMGAYVGLAWMKKNDSIGKMTFLNSHFWEDSADKKKDRVTVSELVYHAKSLYLKTAIPNLFLRPTLYKTEIAAIIQEAETFQSEGIAFAALAMGKRADFTAFVNKNPDKFSMILGSEDSIVPIEKIKETLNHKTMVDIIADCGHMAHIEKSNEVMNLLKKQLVGDEMLN